MNFIELDDAVDEPEIEQKILDTLTKADIASLLYQRMGINKRESRELVEAFFEEIRQELLAGRDVKISGFGNFEVRRKTSRPGRNPRTGELVPIAARTVVSFHPSLKLKAQVSSQHPVTDFLI
jgi:integration host factor subunit alpha